MENPSAEYEIVRRLVWNQHLNVLERKLLPDERARGSLVIRAIIESVHSSGHYPPQRRETDDYSGGILCQKEDGYEIHWKAEIAYLRYATIKVERFASLEDAAQAYGKKEFFAQIDGVMIDWTT
jgi:hypothetical protein